LLTSLEASTVHPAVCIIVDASDADYELPKCTFKVVIATPGIRGQVKQRTHGIVQLKATSGIRYAMVLDDDIVLEADAIEKAIAAVERYAATDPRVVGFALNITNLRKASHLYRRLLFHPRSPGRVTASTFSSSLAGLTADIECDWVLGGAALWNLDFLYANPSNYPFAGKAYSEDLYYCSMVGERGKFVALAAVRCAHVDHYEIRKAKELGREAYREGVNDSRIRMSIARTFHQYSVSLTVIHILWVGFAGIVFGTVAFDRAALMLGCGRLAGLLKSEMSIG
jgi:hypothetical protein